MMFRWQKLTDARGRKWEACDVRDAIAASGLSREQLVLPGQTTPFYQGLLLGGTLIVFLWWLVAKLFFPMLLDIPLWSLSGLTLYGLLFFVPGTIFGIELARNGWHSPRYAIEAMTHAGLCASCGYRINSLQPDSDGCTVCPECGAAWRMP